MRADRRDVDTTDRNPHVNDAKVIPFRLQDQANGFSLALQQQRQRSIAHDRDPKQAQESKSRRPVSPQTAAATGTQSSVTTLLPGEGTPQPLLSLLSTLGSRCEYVDPAAVQHSARPQRPKRALADPESSHCIEVVHPRTGMTFRLSQKDGVWLLSIEEQSLDAAELEPFLTYLRERFAERGLGQVDLIA